MLKQRVLTAMVLAPLALWGLFGLDDNLFILFISAIVLVGSWEWAELSGAGDKGKWLYPAGMAATLLLLNSVRSATLDLFILALAAIGWGIFLLFVLQYPDKSRWTGMRRRLLMGFGVLVPCWIAFIELRTSDWLGKEALLYILLLVWCADIGAYAFGKTFGRKKLAPRVSPGKSWAGVYGGLFTTGVLAVCAASYWELGKLEMVTLVLITLLVTAVSVLGDLLESMVKRHQGLKDSSNLLPGHGGIMDRIDSLTAAAPVFVLCIKLTGLTL
ncbi:phosphatidate cytidylyltransferase [Oceanospirillum sediminis]|uniref:Phosphatidate cytidylyltransferase n=1 Tax=Oceanospirillum sediminis TaxID=2760088 RepID=A0A839IJX7_9GAMM|nr:phosphatidate cytidylyltransferase [Oceanospirillum sediminis]MBB1485040.1 phosphatidate cytidylyltransferase [Oceanospirillum sediminis]